MKKINVAIQILPLKNEKAIEIIEKAIDYIKISGIKHIVCPYETVLEGTYDEIFELIKNLHKICFEAGAEETIFNLKIHSNKEKDILIEQKMKKYI